MPSFVLYERLDADPATGGTWRHRTFRKLDAALAALASAKEVAYITVDGVQRYRKRHGSEGQGEAASVLPLPDSCGDGPGEKGSDDEGSEVQQEAA